MVYDDKGNMLSYFPIMDDVGGLPILANVDADPEVEMVYIGGYERTDYNDSTKPYEFKIMARDVVDGLPVYGFPKTCQGIGGPISDVADSYNSVWVDGLSGSEFITNTTILATIGAQLHRVEIAEAFMPDKQEWNAKYGDAQRTCCYRRIPSDLVGGFGVESRYGVDSFTVGFDAFYVAADTSPVYYRWDFDGDGFVDAHGYDKDAPSHTYTTPGVYDVTLVLSNDVGEVYSETREDFIVVYSNIVADFSAAFTNNVDAPIDVSFTDLSQNGVQFWHWEYNPPGTNGGVRIAICLQKATTSQWIP